jgi:hypothetical protein
MLKVPTRLARVLKRDKFIGFHDALGLAAPLTGWLLTCDSLLDEPGMSLIFEANVSTKT